MKIERALRLKKGEVVWFPEDRGNRAGLAIIRTAGKTVQYNVKEVPFVWVNHEKGTM